MTELTFKTRNGERKTITLRNCDESLFNANCPIDGTQLVRTIGDDSYYIACKNCGRTYYSGDHPDTCTQEKINELYQRETKETNGKLIKLRKETQLEESRLLRIIQELENPFTQA